MIDSNWRSPYQTFVVNPLLPTLVRWEVSPNMYTLAALLSGLAVVPALYFHYVWFAFAVLIVSGFFDTIDGSVARKKNQSSPQGAVFDIVSDRCVEAAVIIGLYLFDPESRGFLCLLMLSSAFVCVTSFLVVGIFTPNESKKGFYYSPGIMERAEAFAFFGAMILFPSQFPVLAVLFSLLVTTTAGIRVWQFCNRS